MFTSAQKISSFFFTEETWIDPLRDIRNPPKKPNEYIINIKNSTSTRLKIDSTVKWNKFGNREEIVVIPHKIDRFNEPKQNDVIRER